MTAPAALSCPSCGKPRAEGLECPWCGIVYERFRGRTKQGPDPKTPPTPAAPVAGPPEAPRDLAGPSVSPSPARTLSDASRCLLLEMAGEALRAGIDLGAFARGPGARAFPPWVGARLEEAAGSGRAPGEVLSEIAALDSADREALDSAGSDAGALAVLLSAIARGIEQRRRGLVRIAKGLGYPALVVFGDALFPPMMTIVSAGTGAWLAAAAARTAAALLLLGGVWFAIDRLDARRNARFAITRALSKVPPLDRLAWNRALAAFAEALAEAVEAKLTPQAALRAAAAASRHPALLSGGPTAALRVEHGTALGEALSSIPELPTAFVARIAHGEIAGTLPKQLRALAAEHDRRAARAVTAAIWTMSIAATVVALLMIARAVTAGWDAAANDLSKSLEMLMQ